MMIWIRKNSKNAPDAAVEVAAAAAAQMEVPVGILLGTVECESDFRLGLTSSAGAVGPCQFLPKYQDDYFRYAGFTFDLFGWDSIRGLAGVYVFYANLGAKRYGFKGEDCWRYALLSHRYGQNSEKAKTLARADRIVDVEAAMRRNGVWYTAVQPQDDDAETARKAVQWALDKLGSPYSQAKRGQEGIFDCSSLVARAYSAQGVSWDLVGSKIPTSTQEVYSDQFELLWPESYDKIGKTLGGASVLRQAVQPGDLQFLCTDKSTTRGNRITHVTLVVDDQTIVHARSTRYGVRKDPLTLYAGKACALLRYNPQTPLRPGMRGLRVAALQKRLNEKGAGLKVDGVYSSATEAAVRKYGEN